MKKNKNGIKILNEAAVAAFEKEMLKAAEKEIEEGSISAPLKEKLKAALKAAAAEKKAAKKAEKAAQLKKSAQKRAAVLRDSAKAAQKLFAFIRGETASLIGDAEEVAKEVYSLSLFSEEEIIEEIFNLFWEEAEEMGEGVREIDLTEKEFIEKARKKDIPKFYIDVIIDGFGGNMYGYEAYILHTFFYEENLKNPKEKMKEKFFRVFKKKTSQFIRKLGRKRDALEKGVARPDLAKHYNIDPKAFNIVDDIARKLGLDPLKAYDSCGVWGISPSKIALSWYASGCKNHPKFRVWVTRTLQVLKNEGRVDFTYIPLPKKGESVNEYKNRLSLDRMMTKWVIEFNLYEENEIKILKSGDRKRLGKISSAFTKYYALTQCRVDVEEYETQDGRKKILQAIDWKKVAEFTKLSKKEKATYLPFKMAWSLLFHRKFPAGLGENDPHPVVLTDRVTQKTFRQLMKIVKSESYDKSALEANTKAAYHLAVAFRDMQTVKRWVKVVTNEDLSAYSIHDAFVDANVFMKVSNREAWAAFLAQFPELRWYIKHALSFEMEHGRMPSGKREFNNFVAQRKYEGVTDKTVASIAAELGLDQDDFEDYQEFFEKNPKKTSTMLPHIQVSEGEYTFRKLDDHDKRGPFLGLITDCCQHLHNAGSSCAKAGWRDPESGFYVVEKNGGIVAQSWAWRGKNGELCFDSIEGLGHINTEVIAGLYQKAAQKLLGKLDIIRVTVGDTDYGLTPDIKAVLGGKNCKPAEMIKEVSYTDAYDQWLLAE